MSGYTLVSYFATIAHMNIQMVLAPVPSYHNILMYC